MFGSYSEHIERNLNRATPKDHGRWKEEEIARRGSIECSFNWYLLRFEPQLLSYALAVNVHMLRADLIALNLSEGSIG